MLPEREAFFMYESSLRSVTAASGSYKKAVFP